MLVLKRLTDTKGETRVFPSTVSDEYRQLLTGQVDPELVKRWHASLTEHHPNTIKVVVQVDRVGVELLPDGQYVVVPHESINDPHCL